MIALINLPEGWLALLLVAAVAVVLGWALGRRGRPSSVTTSPAAPSSPSGLARTKTPQAVVSLPVPKRKLFLSWAAVMHAVQTRAVSEDDLADCLFCMSTAELNLAEEYSISWFERLHPHFKAAARDGRLICPLETERYNATTAREVNALLSRHGCGPLTWGDVESTLEQIPMHACVPSVTDGSLEVRWAAHPLRGDWRRCWGRSLAEIEAAMAGEPDEPQHTGPTWMDELNRPIIDELRRKHELRPQQEGNDNGDGTQGDEDDDADAWKRA